jgi:glycosyltransferase involved in cell wall biosynthesis
MRVLMTADAVGGVWTYAVELARALAALDIQTTLATMGPPPSIDQVADAIDVPGLDLSTSTFKLEWMDDPWRDVAAAGDWLLDLEQQTQPDVVHVNGYAHAALPFRAPVVVAGHSCVASWAEATGGRIDPRWLAQYREAVAAGLRAADWVVAPTAAMLGALQRLYGPVRDASVIANGRDPDLFQPIAARDKEPFVFSAGRLWDRAKNVQALASIAPSLTWPVYVAGDGRVDGAVCALGPLSPTEVAAWLSRAAIFALPARYEPFGLLPLEAALSGCALVLGDIPSLREVWGDAAVYVNPDRLDALHDAVERLTHDAAERARYAEAAAARGREYTPERMAQAYARIYGLVTSAALAGTRAS